MKERRVGSITLGVSLIVFGVLFLIRIFVPSFDYIQVMKFWPIILILLGIELLVYGIVKKDAPIKLDILSLLITFLVMIFSMGMAAAEFAVEYLQNTPGVLR